MTPQRPEAEGEVGAGTSTPAAHGMAACVARVRRHGS